MLVHDNLVYILQVALFDIVAHAIFNHRNSFIYVIGLTSITLSEAVHLVLNESFHLFDL